MHFVVIDVVCTKKLRIISLYRSFRPPGNQSPDTFFVKQLELIETAICKDCYIMGDFNLDAKMENRPDYDRKNLLEKISTLSLEKNLVQIVNFDTWSRVINGIKKSSILDHVYVNNVATISDITFETPFLETMFLWLSI